jgi:hypothetical protein
LQCGLERFATNAAGPHVRYLAANRVIQEMRRCRVETARPIQNQTDRCITSNDCRKEFAVERYFFELKEPAINHTRLWLITIGAKKNAASPACELRLTGGSVNGVQSALHTHALSKNDQNVGRIVTV